MAPDIIPTRTVSQSTSHTQRQVSHAPTNSLPPHCTPFTLPSHGHFVIAPNTTITLSSNAVFTPECAPSRAFDKIDDLSITDVKAPFHASVTPQAYATGAATVMAWMLVIMLVITPRTFFIGGMGGGVGLLGRRGMISGAQGGASVIGVGSRPWLQKVAALTVAVSLTIATADTFDVAQRQYVNGFMNAESLRAEVVNSVQMRVSRVISDIFLWLAQVQTLIRLFPRHKEKVLIKWIGFALIILDSTFSCLNNFYGKPVNRPRQFREAVPALSYLFQLALSMLYAAWVLYYAICKRRYAFYHSLMWNVSVVAMMSVIAIATPVVFFITDISNPAVAGWGDYFRWVGAAAASVIVWEWVERIEALEREEKKDGILGREVFDGDDSDGTSDILYRRRRPRQTRRFWAGRGSPDDHEGFASGVEKTRYSRPGQHKSETRPAINVAAASNTAVVPTGVVALPENVGAPYLSVPTPPPQTVSPISRSDTASAASTVYTVHYNTVNIATPPVARPIIAAQRASRNLEPEEPRPSQLTREATSFSSQQQSSSSTRNPEPESQPKNKWHLGHPFKRRKVLPPAEVRQGHVIDPVEIGTSPKTQHSHAQSYATWDIKGRLGAFAAETGEKWRERGNRSEKELDLPVTIIPAPPRGGNSSRERPWSPEGEATTAGEAERGGSRGNESRVGLLRDDEGSEGSKPGSREGDAVGLGIGDPSASETPQLPPVATATGTELGDGIAKTGAGP